MPSLCAWCQSVAWNRPARKRTSSPITTTSLSSPPLVGVRRSLSSSPAAMQWPLAAWMRPGNDSTSSLSDGTAEADWCLDLSGDAARSHAVRSRRPVARNRCDLEQRQPEQAGVHLGAESVSAELFEIEVEVRGDALGDELGAMKRHVAEALVRRLATFLVLGRLNAIVLDAAGVDPAIPSASMNPERARGTRSMPAMLSRRPTGTSRLT